MIAEKVAYLANVLSIACADGKLSRREDSVLHSIAQNIGATSADIDEAKRLLMRGDYRLIPLRVTAERLQNIEDMVMVAMADGSLSGHETTPIERFTDSIGLTQHEMDAIVTRAQARLRSADPGATPRRTIRRRAVTAPSAPQYHPRAPKPPAAPPPVPQSAVQKPKPPPPPVSRPQRPKPPPPPVTPPPPPPTARKKPERRPRQRRERPPRPVRPAREISGLGPLRSARQPGMSSTPPLARPAPAPRPQPERRRAEPAWVPPSQGITIAFAGIASDALQLALREMGSASDRGEYETATTKWYYAVWPPAEIRLAARCALAAAALTGHVVYVEGKQGDWNEVFGFCACALARLASDTPEGYCFGCEGEFLNVWGCRQARMDWSESADWFGLGSFEGSDGFRFDKTGIWNLLQANLARVEHCPFLNLDRMRAALETLPDQIKARGRWRFREAQADSGRAETRIVSENTQGCLFAYETLVDGVAPTDDYDALRLISRVTKAVDGKPIDAACLKRSIGGW